MDAHFVLKICEPIAEPETTAHVPVCTDRGGGGGGEGRCYVLHSYFLTCKNVGLLQSGTCSCIYISKE